jgi:hypothetical protein
MPYTYNPLLKVGLDQTGAGGGTPGGSDTEIQYNDDGAFGGSADLTWDDTGKVLEIGGDINLDDGGTYETTLQVVTPTANRTISFPDATGTVALVAGSSGQVAYNNAGAYSGLSTVTTDGTDVTLTGRFIGSLNGALSATGIAGVPVAATGTWITGGTATTTKPQVLIEPTGATSTAWSTSGTGLGVNAASGFAGNLLDLQVNGTSRFYANNEGSIGFCSLYAIFGNSNQISFRTYAQNSTVVFFDLSISGGPSLRNAVNSYVGWCDNNNPGTGTLDLTLLRDAANTLAQRRTTNAQTFRIYGTYTNASNYVRASLSSTSTAVTLAAETAGTGADDIPLNLTAAGTGTVKVNSNLEIADAKDIVLATGTGTKIGTATTQKLGFFGADPVVQQTELTDELTTITHTAPGTPDYAIQNLVAATGYGFVTEDEGNTVLSVIANLQARVNELETKLVALGFLADAD